MLPMIFNDVNMYGINKKIKQRRTNCFTIILKFKMN